MPLQVVQVRDDLLGKLGYPVAASAPALALTDIVTAINGAMQMLQSAGEDFFTRETITQTISAGTASYMLPQNVQSILGPIRLGTAPLVALESEGQYDQYGRIFAGATAFGAGTGTPRAYHVQNLRWGTIGDINRIFVFLAPVPVASGQLAMDIIREAPSYVVADLSSTDPIPCAQNYTETILLPIARFLVTRSVLFTRQELLPQLKADYQDALETLGFKGGFPNANQPVPQREVQA